MAGRPEKCKRLCESVCLHVRVCWVCYSQGNDACENVLRPTKCTVDSQVSVAIVSNTFIKSVLKTHPTMCHQKSTVLQYLHFVSSYVPRCPPS